VASTHCLRKHLHEQGARRHIRALSESGTPAFEELLDGFELRALVTGCFSVAAPVIVAAEEFVGFRVDGDEFAVAPGARVVLVSDGEAVDGVAHGFELVGDLGGELLFEVEAIRQVLVMEARSVRRLLDVEAVVDDADEIVGDGGDDGRTARTAED
jgi:hypothetical protein